MRVERQCGVVVRCRKVAEKVMPGLQEGEQRMRAWTWAPRIEMSNGTPSVEDMRKPAASRYIWILVAYETSGKDGNAGIEVG